MKKRILLTIALFTLTFAHSQEMYFLTGSNFTKYDFESNAQGMSMPIQRGSGTTYELGYSCPLQEPGFSYLLAVTLNNYNSLAGTSANTYEWTTKYLGGQGGFMYTHEFSDLFSIAAKAGINLSTIVYGKQTIDGAVYDLVSQKEFSGLLFSPFAGLQTQYSPTKYGYFSFGYGISKGINLSNNTQEKLSFNTNQLVFGIHLNIN